MVLDAISRPDGPTRICAASAMSAVTAAAGPRHRNTPWLCWTRGPHFRRHAARVTRDTRIPRIPHSVSPAPHDARGKLGRVVCLTAAGPGAAARWRSRTLAGAAGGRAPSTLPHRRCRAPGRRRLGRPPSQPSPHCHMQAGGGGWGRWGRLGAAAGGGGWGRRLGAAAGGGGWGWRAAGVGAGRCVPRRAALPPRAAAAALKRSDPTRARLGRSRAVRAGRCRRRAGPMPPPAPRRRGGVSRVPGDSDAGISRWPLGRRLVVSGAEPVHELLMRGLEIQEELAGRRGRANVGDNDSNHRYNTNTNDKSGNTSKNASIHIVIFEDWDELVEEGEGRENIGKQASGGGRDGRETGAMGRGEGRDKTAGVETV